MQSSQTVASLIHQVGRLEQELLAQRLKASGVTPDQARALRYVALHAGTNQRALGQALKRQPASLSNLLKGLIKRGWLDRQVAPGNDREKQLRLSTVGQAQLSQIDQSFTELNGVVEQSLTDSEVAQLQALLLKVHDDWEGRH